jgi:hypothetical protein
VAVGKTKKQKQKQEKKVSPKPHQLSARPSPALPVCGREKKTKKKKKKRLPLLPSRRGRTGAGWQPQ